MTKEEKMQCECEKIYDELRSKLSKSIMKKIYKLVELEGELRMIEVGVL